MYKVLITGGASFIGSAIERYLLSCAQHNVVNLDKLTHADNLESISESLKNDRYVFELINICDVVELNRVLQTHQPDMVMHLAAEIHVDRSIDGLGEFIQTNVVGTYTLL